MDGGNTRDNFWLSSILVDPEEAGFETKELRLALADQNVESRPLWKPMHLQPVFAENRVFTDGVGEKLFKHGLSLPSGSVLEDAQRERIAKTISQFLEKTHAA